MKFISLGLCLVLCFSACQSDKTKGMVLDVEGFTLLDDKTLTEKDVLQSFYEGYITACSNMDEDALSILETTYVSDALLLKLDSLELDYNPFLKAQDCDVSTLESLKISTVDDEKKLYEVSYDWGDGSVISIFLVVSDVDGYFLITDLMLDE